MISEIDIFRSAHLMIDQHGKDASIQSAMKADELLAEGDVDGVAVWHRIIVAISALSLTEAPDVTH